MCESTLVMAKNGEKVVLMNDVARVLVSDTKLECFGILGTKKNFKKVRITEINLVDHTIVLQQI